MADLTPSMLANSIMGKIYDVLTNGDATVPKSGDNFFSWCTPGIPVTEEDFEFLTQGFTGTLSKAAIDLVTGASSTPAAAGAEPAAPVQLSPAQLDQLRGEHTARLHLQAEAFSHLVDFVPDVARIDNEQFAKLAVMNDEGSLSEIYERTLKFSQVMKSELTADELKKIEHFRSLLTATTETTDIITGDKKQVSGASALVLAYNAKMAAYEDIALEYNARRIDALSAANSQAVNYWAINAKILRNKVKAAMDDWISSGYKVQFEQIAAYIAQVEGRDLTLLKQAYIDDLDKAKLTGLASGSEYYYSSMVPANFVKASSWSKFTFNSADHEHHANSHFKSSGWEAHASAGFLGIGGSGGASASQSSQSYEGSFDSNFFNLSFEVAQAFIYRPWMHASYLASKAWRFDPSNVDLKGDVISDGASPPTGLMPAYPTSIIFIRNLVLNFGHNEAFSKFLDKRKASSQGGSASFGLGPFSFGGGASHFSQNRDSQRDSGAKHTDQGLSVPGMQIIGFKCHVMPKSPNPAPGIKEWV